VNIKTDRFTIRPFTPDDLPAVFEVYRQCEDFLALGPNPHASLKMVEADWELSRAQNGDFCCILNPVGEVIGVVDVIPHHFEGLPDHAFIELLMIAQPHRAAGLGTAIVRAVENDLIQHNALSAILSGVQVNNEGGCRVWQRMGYRIISGPTLLPDQTTVYALRKDLPG